MLYGHEKQGKGYINVVRIERTDDSVDGLKTPDASWLDMEGAEAN
jgi:hypothetical protein